MSEKKGIKDDSKATGKVQLPLTKLYKKTVGEGSKSVGGGTFSLGCIKV